MFANVSIINVPIALELEYFVPFSLESVIFAGCLLSVPLGARKELGVALELYTERRTKAELFPIDAVIKEVPSVSRERIAFAKALSAATAQPIGQYLRKLLPVELGVTFEKQNIAGYEPEDTGEEDLAHFESLRQAAAGSNRYILVPKKITKRSSRNFEVNPGSEFLAETRGFGRVKAVADRRSDAFIYIRQEGPVADQWIIASSGCNSEDIKWLLANKFIRRTEQKTLADQEVALSQPIKSGQKMDGSRFPEGQISVYQYSGGSKVIEVFRQEIERYLSANRSVWLIYPETFEVETSAEYFRSRVGLDPTVYHGGISENRRTEIWGELSDGNIRFVIGTLDALFLPARNPGLIILDEPQHCRSHPSKRLVLNAETIADAIQHHFGTTNIYASVLPSVAANFNARYKVPNAFGKVSGFVADETPTMQPKAEIVDMAAELKNGNTLPISAALRDSILNSIQAGKPSLIYLNRKGFANYIFCRDCGFTRRCDDCGAVIQVRQDPARGPVDEVCGQCGQVNKIEQKCPSCGSKNYRPFGAGIKKIEETCRVFAPEARIALWEAGGGQDRAEITYARLLNGEIDILIGTQAISKNIRFPAIGTLGFALVESAFNHPDPFRIENAFRTHLDLIAKTDQDTKIIMQTYQPAENLWRLLMEGDKAGFINAQLNGRALVDFPPFGSITLLTYRHKNIETANEKMQETRRKVIQLGNNEGIENFEVQEVSPDEGRILRLYSSRLILKNFPNHLIERLSLDAGWRIDVSPNSLTE